MKTHTPGPYHIDDMTHIDADNLPRNWIAVVDHDGKEDGGLGSVVCYCHEQNAPLFSSAPALLAALESLVEFADYGTPVHPGCELWQDARSALSLARGSNPSPTLDPRDAEIARLREAVSRMSEIAMGDGLDMLRPFSEVDLMTRHAREAQASAARGVMLTLRDIARAALAEGGAR